MWEDHHGTLPYSFSKYSGAKAGVSTNSRTQTEVIATAESDTQTAPVVVLTLQQFKAVKETGIVPPSQEVAAPPEESLLDPLSEPVFKVKSLGRQMLLTNREIRTRKMSDPELQRARVSLNCKQRKALRARIRQRISKSYRDRRNFSTASYIKKKCRRKNLINPDEVVIDPRQTRTIRKLTDFFVAEYQQRGVAGLPVNMEEVDPSYTDDEYEA